MNLDALKSALTKKIGPLPAWAWGLVIGGGFIAFRLLSGRGLSSGESEPATEQTAEATYEGSGQDSGGYFGGTLSPGSGSSFTVPTGYVPESFVDELASARASAQYQKTRARNWKAWGQRWKKIAKRNNAKSAKRQPNKRPKTKRTAPRFDRAGTVLSARQIAAQRHKASRSNFHNRTDNKRRPNVRKVSK